jgi:hypothetical protein
MKLEICVKRRLGRYQLWIAENDTDWTTHLRSRNAEDVAAMVDDHAQRLGVRTYPDVVVVDEAGKQVPMPKELRMALEALGPKPD